MGGASRFPIGGGQLRWTESHPSRARNARIERGGSLSLGPPSAQRYATVVVVAFALLGVTGSFPLSVSGAAGSFPWSANSSEPSGPAHAGVAAAHELGSSPGKGVSDSQGQAPPCGVGRSPPLAGTGCPVRASARTSASAGSNSSPVAEIGSFGGNVNVGETPTGVAVDTSNGWLYVTNFAGGTVSVLNGTDLISTVDVGGPTTQPYGIVYDPYNGLVYVTDSGTSSVVILNGTRVVDTLVVQADPLGLAVDPGTGLVYVAESSEDNVTILNGTTVVGAYPAGVQPTDVAYSSLNGDMYISDWGEANVTVLNGTHRVAHIAVQAGPKGIAYDPDTGYIYVSDSGTANVSEIYNLNVARTIAVQSGPDGIAVDGANGYAYVANQANSTVSVLNQTRVLATLGVGTDPEGVAYDPQSGFVYTADALADLVTGVSTILGIAAPVINDQGVQVEATDVNQTLNVTALLWAPGSGTDVASYYVHPSPGFGCTSGPNLTSYGFAAIVNLTCTPRTPGTYSIWLNVTDHDGSKVWSTVSVPVAPALDVMAPVYSAIYVAGIATADVNVSIALSEIASGGSGVYVTFRWYGLTGAVCQQLDSPDPTCVFPIAAPYEVSVKVTDSNLATSAGPPSPLHVFVLPSAAKPTSNRSVVDVHEPVKFFEAASGGPGTYSYAWAGLSSASCSGLSGSSPACTFATPGNYNVSVLVTDTVDTTVASPGLPIVVLPLPTVGPPVATRTTLDVGESVTLSTNATGGFGNYSFSWQGLPLDCQRTDTAEPTCTATSPGTWIIWPVVLDGDGGIAVSSATVSVLVNPAPTVAAPTVSARSIGLGAQVTFSADPVGGTGGYTFNWTGLPPGCSGAGREVRCTPSDTGSFEVSVEIKDGAGLTAHSASTSLTVRSASFLPMWLPLSAFVTVVVVAAVAVVIAGALVIRRRRRRSGYLEPEPEPEPAPPETPG
jgi:YVTN family beta-propeller protein